MQKVTLLELVKTLKIEEQNIFKNEERVLSSKERSKSYRLEIILEDMSAIENCFGIEEFQIKKVEI